MSDANLARRTSVEVAFDGTDITSSIKPYLLSLVYTDNEADETDDLQISLQDRDSIWMEQWLGSMIDAASEASASGTAASYKVTPKIGLNVRTGPGTSYTKLGALTCGTVITVSSIENGWAAISYNGQTAYVCATYIQAVDGAAEAQTSSGTALAIQAVIVRENWTGDGKDKVLDCGGFEMDGIDASGPPATITVKGTSLPFSAAIRQTEKSRAWESYTLSGIAREMAGNCGMVCMYESDSDPYYARVEQYKTSDISFLSILCQNAGVSLKVTNKIIVLFDQATYEGKDAVRTIKRGDGSYTKYKLSVGTADTQYSSCRVRYTDPATGKSISGTATDDSINSEQCLEITAKVESASEAMALAGKLLRLHNKYARTATITMPGDPDLVAGVTVMLADWGCWNGKYIITRAKHTVNSSGYTVQVKLRKVLEGY